MLHEVPREPILIDFNSAYKTEGLEGVGVLYDAALREAGIRTPTPHTRTLYNIADLGKFPPPEWLIQGEIPAHALTLLYGASGGGKSFVGIDYALRITQQGRAVIYLAAEGVSGYYDRTTAWCKHHKYSGEGLRFDIQPLELRDPVAVTAFIEAIKSLKPALVIIDTLARCMIGLDENSARDMGLAVEACATIIRETGAAVMLVHHTGKNGTGERGSSALFAACDSVISLSNDDGLLTLSCGKSKDSQPFNDRYMRIVEVATAEGRSSCVAMSADRVLTQGAALSPTQKKILETLALETFVEVGAKALTVQRATAIPDTSLYRALGALMRGGYVRQAVKGDPYYIEAKGIQALKALYAQTEPLPPVPNHSHESSGSDHNNHSHPLPPPYRVGVVVVDGGSSNGADQPQDRPLFDEVFKPLHKSNGERR